jgi:acyl-CoA hydrolase
MPLDVALIQVSPPDAHGFCSFGVSVDTTLTAAECARYVVAQVNDQMPRTYGDSFIHVSKIHAIVETSRPLCELKKPEIKPIIALSSTAKNGTISRIAPMLSPGAGVVTSRGLIRYVVTEYGVAYLHGKSIRERAKALIRDRASQVS